MSPDLIAASAFSISLRSVSGAFWKLCSTRSTSIFCLSRQPTVHGKASATKRAIATNQFFVLIVEFDFGRLKCRHYPWPVKVQLEQRGSQSKTAVTSLGKTFADRSRTWLRILRVIG